LAQEKTGEFWVDSQLFGQPQCHTTGDYERAEVAEADAVARAVDAIDHDADRGFQTGVVADRADAADARGRDRLVAGRGDDQARRQQRQVLDVAHAGVLQQLRVDRSDHDRHVLQVLLAALGRYDDLIQPTFGSIILGERGQRGAAQ